MGWIDNLNASVVQAWAAVAQGVLGFAILIATGVYAYLTRRIATETKRLADDTRDLAVAADRQRFAAARPVLVFAPNVGPDGGIGLTNVGVGPAVHVQVVMEDSVYKLVPMPRQQLSVPIQHSFVLRPGEGAFFGLDWVDNPVSGVKITGHLKALYGDVYNRRLSVEQSFEQPVGLPGVENLQIGKPVFNESLSGDGRQESQRLAPPPPSRGSPLALTDEVRNP